MVYCSSASTSHLVDSNQFVRINCPTFTTKVSNCQYTVIAATKHPTPALARMGGLTVLDLPQMSSNAPRAQTRAKQSVMKYRQTTPQSEANTRIESDHFIGSATECKAAERTHRTTSDSYRMGEKKEPIPKCKFHPFVQAILRTFTKRNPCPVSVQKRLRRISSALKRAVNTFGNTLHSPSVWRNHKQKPISKLLPPSLPPSILRP